MTFSEFQSQPKTRSAWYGSEVLVVLLLILFFPVGLYGLWKHPGWSSGIKSFITVIVLLPLLLWLFMIIFGALGL